MGAGTRQRYQLAAVIQQERDKTPSIEIEAGGGQVFTIDAPALWPDDIFEAASAGRIVDAGRLLLGESYEVFTQAGGTSALLFQIIQDAQGASLGESAASTSASEITGRLSSAISSPSDSTSPTSEEASATAV
jgi:hypothetical protein